MGTVSVIMGDHLTDHDPALRQWRQLSASACDHIGGGQRHQQDQQHGDNGNEGAVAHSKQKLRVGKKLFNVGKCDVFGDQAGSYAVDLSFGFQCVADTHQKREGDETHQKSHQDEPKRLTGNGSLLYCHQFTPASFLLTARM